MSSLQINATSIDERFYIVHGVSTAIGADSIGKNCCIYQNVTVGSSKVGRPTILDNVTIYAGATIIGKIIIGNNVVIGANATVFKDVPDNCVVYPPLSSIVKFHPPGINIF